MYVKVVVARDHLPRQILVQVTRPCIPLLTRDPEVILPTAAASASWTFLAMIVGLLKQELRKINLPMFCSPDFEFVFIHTY